MLRDYEVTIELKFPSYGTTSSTEVFSAKSSNDAIKQARELMSRNGHTRQDGPVKYSAKLIR